MSKIVSVCQRCGKKNVQETGRSKLGDFHYITLDCGHTYSEKGISSSGLNEIRLKDGRTLFPFQVSGVRFLEANNFRGLISDEMGLGKTIQAVGGIGLHYEDLKPILIVVKASLTYQWFKEVFSGTGKFCQIIDSRTPPIPGMQIFITSYDSIPPRKVKGKEEVKGGLIEVIKKLKIKTVILDECQMLKNHLSSRTQAVRDIVRDAQIRTDNRNPLQRERIETIARDLLKFHGLDGRFELFFTDIDSEILGLCESRAENGIIRGKITIQRFHAENSNEDDVIETILHEIAHAVTPSAGHTTVWSNLAKQIGSNGTPYGWCSGAIELQPKMRTVQHIIALSGTPIKNNAIEYFPILNLLQPERYPNRDRFIRHEVDFYSDGYTTRAGGLRYPEQFIEKNKDFIIRRTRKEVLPDLPAIQRDYKYYPMMAEVWKRYNKKVGELAEFMEESEGKDSFSLQGDLLAQLQILRHITAFAKIDSVVEYLEEFLEENPGEKITVFVHHIDVGDTLEEYFEKTQPGLVTRIKSSQDAETRMKKIEEFRGEKRMLIAPTLAAGEGINLQFCSHAMMMEREWNPANEEQAEGRFSRIGSTANSILVCYPTATGTIDEFFAELVERKREAVTKTLDGKAEPWNQANVMRDLANLVVKKWRSMING